MANAAKKNDDLIMELVKDPNYQINEDGTVFTLVQLNGKVGTTWRKAGNEDTPDGYVRMRYKGVNLRLHRIIWAKFNGYLRIDLVVNHIDGDKRNNHINNLELVTESTNHKHAYRYLGKNPNRGAAKLSWNTVHDIRKDWKSGLYTQRKLMEKYDLKKTTVHEIVTEKTYKPELENGKN